MGEITPPTAADYANSSANRANERILKLEQELEYWRGRVRDIEEKFELFHNSVRRIETMYGLLAGGRRERL